MANAASTPQTGHVHCDVIVADGFVLTEFAAVVDVLRLSNRISNREVFRWQFRSMHGGAIQSSSGAMVETIPQNTRSDAAYAFILGNTDPRHPSLSMPATVSEYTARQTRVILLSEAASRYIAEKRSDADAQHTTHWENRAVLQEQFGLFDTKSALAVDGGAIVTCAGMGATVDVVLSIAAAHLSSATTMTVADVLLHERIRHYNTQQPYAGRAAVATGDSDVDTCISLMQDNIEFPLSIAEIATQSKASKRSLERKFHAVLHTTPNGYYRELRLSKANTLLLNTDMSINEIGLACGFPSGFSAIYKTSFGMTPKAARRKTQTS